MASDKDSEQDALIRRNTERINENAEALRRQTAALEQIRDHYFPRKTFWRAACGIVLKFVGAVTLVTGVMEGVEWYLNDRESENMASQCAAVAQRLFYQENDFEGATRFLEKAVALDSDTVRYRISLSGIKGFAALADLFDLGRPLTKAERSRVDGILAESVFLQEVAAEEAMPYVLASQIYGLRGERELAVEFAERAVAVEPENVQAHVTACAMNFVAGRIDEARAQLAAAERLNPEFPLVWYWKGFLALMLDRDLSTARSAADAMVRLAPRLAVAHLFRGRVLSAGDTPDLAAARAEFERALVCSPSMTQAMVEMASTYARENGLVMARLWLDRALEQRPGDMKALLARAELVIREKRWEQAIADLGVAIGYAPFRADLYRKRAEVLRQSGSGSAAVEDEAVARALEADSPTQRKPAE